MPGMHKSNCHGCICIRAHAKDWVHTKKGIRYIYAKDVGKVRNRM